MDATGICYRVADDLLLAPGHGGEAVHMSKHHFCDNSKLEPSALGRSQLYLVTHTEHKLALRLL